MPLLKWLLLFAVFVPTLSADVVIRLSGDQDPVCGPPFLCLTNNAVTVDTDPNGGGFFDIVNGENGAINSLHFDLDYVDGACPSGSPTAPTFLLDPSFLKFAAGGLNVRSQARCTSQLDVAEYLLSLYFSPGIPALSQFQVTLNSDSSADPNGAGGYVPNQSSTVGAATATPEPRLFACFGLSLLLLSWGAKSGVLRVSKR